MVGIDPDLFLFPKDRQDIIQKIDKGLDCVTTLLAHVTPEAPLMVMMATGEDLVLEHKEVLLLKKACCQILWKGLSEELKPEKQELENVSWFFFFFPFLFSFLFFLYFFGFFFLMCFCRL